MLNVGVEAVKKRRIKSIREDIKVFLDCISEGDTDTALISDWRQKSSNYGYICRVYPEAGRHIGRAVSCLRQIPGRLARGFNPELDWEDARQAMEEALKEIK